MFFVVAYAFQQFKLDTAIALDRSLNDFITDFMIQISDNTAFTVLDLFDLPILSFLLKVFPEILILVVDMLCFFSQALNFLLNIDFQTTSIKSTR